MAVSIINSVAAALKNSSIALLVALLFIYGATYREMETENDYETRDSRGVQQRNEISVLSFPLSRFILRFVRPSKLEKKPCQGFKRRHFDETRYLPGIEGLKSGKE